MTRQVSIIPCPERQALSDALDHINAQSTHVFQVLYAHDLITAGGGGPLSLVREASGIHTMLTLRVTLRWPKGYEDTLYFRTVGDEPNEDILRKAKLLVEGAGKPKTHYACCCHAVPRHCGCAASFSCDLHGITCNGTHD